MQVVRLLLILYVIALSLFSATLGHARVTAKAPVPDRLEILRTVGMSSHTPVHEMVTQLRSVQDLYGAMLSLPVAPTDQICPQYIVANYKLTFFFKNMVVQKANALNGECQPVTLGHDDVRTADVQFWQLINRAFAVGIPIQTSVNGKVASSSN